MPDFNTDDILPAETFPFEVNIIAQFFTLR